MVKKGDSPFSIEEERKNKFMDEYVKRVNRFEYVAYKIIKGKTGMIKRILQNFIRKKL